MAIFKTLQNYQTRSIDKIEEPVDAEEIYENASADTEYLDAQASVHPAVPVDGAKDDGYTHNTPAYTVKIDRYILIIPVKTISRHGGQSTRRLMNRIPEKLHCFLKNFLSTTKRSVRVTNYSI